MASPRQVKIGTRGSPLALYQAQFIANALNSVSNGALRGEIVTLTTKGDQLTTERLINSGGKGLFTREIDAAVDRGDVDIAVHSLKDVPSDLPDGQAILAYPERADARDGFIARGGLARLEDLPKGAVLGTASLRRESQVLALRPDLKIVPFRGNVQTRLKKLEAGEADATFLAMAGLERLDMAHLATPVPISTMLPAAGQGIIAVAARPDAVTKDLAEALGQIDHAPTRAMAVTERAFLKELDGSCRTAMAAHASLQQGSWWLRAEVLQPDGQQRWTGEARALLSADHDELADMARAVGQAIRRAAGGSLPVFEDA